MLKIECRDCNEEEECENEESCVRGKCYSPCTDNCSHSFTTCHADGNCSHMIDYICEQGICLPSQCNESILCADSFSCEEGRCLAQCNNSRNCTYGLQCIFGNCMQPCKVYATGCLDTCSKDLEECAENKECREGVCTDMCSDGSTARGINSCMLGLKCVNGACLVGCDSYSCDDDQFCDNSTVCRQKTFSGSRSTRDPFGDKVEIMKPKYKDAEKRSRENISSNVVTIKLYTKSMSLLVNEELCDTCDPPFKSNCNCDSQPITAASCLHYPILCPPESQTPEGYVQRSPDVSSLCTDLLTQSVCDDQRGQCVCQDDLGHVRYAGAVCQLRLRACTWRSRPCPVLHICNDGYCYRTCNTSKVCEQGTRCHRGLCLLQCQGDEDCLSFQKCSLDVCVADPAKGPPAVQGSSCPDCTDPFEVCSGESCTCIEGMRHSMTAPFQCEWSADETCFKCPVCNGQTPCADPNMKCSSKTGMCICKPGHKLDADKNQCSVKDGTQTAICCTEIAECSLLPKSTCIKGRCQCAEGYCYKERMCIPDINECEGRTCPEGQTCVNRLCATDSTAWCVDVSQTRIVKTFSECSFDDDCWPFYGDRSVCRGGRCDCQRFSKIKDTICEPTGECATDAHCDWEETCLNNACTAKESVESGKSRSAKLSGEDGEKMSGSASVGSAVVGGVLLLGTTLFIGFLLKRRENDIEIRNSERGPGLTGSSSKYIEDGSHTDKGRDLEKTLNELDDGPSKHTLAPTEHDIELENLPRVIVSTPSAFGSALRDENSYEMKAVNSLEVV